jgi:ERF superfamily
VSAPSVYAAINAITAEFATSGIAKTRTNEVDDYKYRSIDDVFDRLAPLLAKHRLCVLPKALERFVTERADGQNRLLLHVVLRVSFTLTSVDDGSSDVVEAYGEALDGGDKATAKAMSAAYKAAMVQTFCIPISGTEDADRTSHRISSKTHEAEPLQGWTQWCLDIEDIVALCESEQAISTVQEIHRDLLKALAREQAELYAELGEAFIARREELAKRTPKRKPVRSRKQAKASGAEPEVEHA